MLFLLRCTFILCRQWYIHTSMLGYVVSSNFGLHLWIYRKLIKSFIQGFLPGIALKIFLILLPTILMLMSKFEGFVALSILERKAASKYYLFLLVNVFLGNIITGAAFQQLNTFIHQSVNKYDLLSSSNLTSEYIRKFTVQKHRLTKNAFSFWILKRILSTSKKKGEIFSQNLNFLFIYFKLSI